MCEVGTTISMLLVSCHVRVVSNSFVTPWTVPCQAPLSIGFPRQEYWSGLPFPSPRDFPNPGIKPSSPASQGDSLPLSHQGSHKVSIHAVITCNSSFPLSYSLNKNALGCRKLESTEHLIMNITGSCFSLVLTRFKVKNPHPP